MPTPPTPKTWDLRDVADVATDPDGAVQLTGAHPRCRRFRVGDHVTVHAGTYRLVSVSWPELGERFAATAEALDADAPVVDEEA